MRADRGGGECVVPPPVAVPQHAGPVDRRLGDDDAQVVDDAQVDAIAGRSAAGARTSAKSDMTKPGVQNPHCEASRATMARWLTSAPLGSPVVPEV